MARVTPGIGNKYRLSDSCPKEQRFRFGKFDEFFDYENDSEIDGCTEIKDCMIEITDVEARFGSVEILAFIPEEQITFRADWLYIRQYINPILTVTYNKLWIDLNE